MTKNIFLVNHIITVGNRKQINFLKKSSYPIYKTASGADVRS